MLVSPKFNIGESIYIRESAALGFIESFKISSVLRSTNNEWVYTIDIGGKLPAPPLFGERISHQQGKVLYLNESELIDKCEAYELIENTLTNKLLQIQARRASECP